jgi:hypothetical protein
VDFTELLDPSLQQAMRSRFVQDLQLQVQPPYNQSIPKEFIDAEKPKPQLQGDWEPLSRAERDQMLQERGMRYGTPEESLKLQQLQPVMRYDGQRISVDATPLVNI